MKPYTIEKLTEIRDALIEGYPLNAATRLQELTNKMELAHRGRKSLILDELHEAKHKLRCNDQLAVMKILNGLIERMERMFRDSQQRDDTQEIDYGNNGRTEAETPEVHRQ
jgi:hypothetical protein